jgi:HD-GYP domain-containing protein (c-di-GMP phosphodiesterase class II)
MPHWSNFSMSSDPRAGVPSQATDQLASPDSELTLAAQALARGQVLLDGLERHLPGSRRHADGTASYAFAGAVELGADRARAELVREAARLHDVGKVYLPAAVLARRGEELDARERALMDSHPAYGAALAIGAGVPDAACEWIGAAGERFDGAGGHGLAGADIPREARIIRVACACDGVLSRRPASAQALPWIASAELRAAAGRELDPRAVEAMAAVLERAARSTG